MTVIPSNATEEEIREAFPEDADAVIAFRRFLAFDKGERPILLPQHWHDYATGKIGATEVLALDT